MLPHRFHLGLPLILLAVLAPLAEAQEPANKGVVHFRGENQTSATPFVRWYIDEEGDARLTDIQRMDAAGELRAANGEFLERGVMQGTMWVALTIHNSSNSDELVLELRNPRLSHVDFYVSDERGYHKHLNGTARPFYSRTIWYPMPAVELTVPASGESTVFIRVHNTGVMRLRLWLWSSSAFYARMGIAYQPETIIIGIILSLAVFHLLVFLSLRISAYLHLSLFLCSWLLFFMSLNGTGSMFIWPNNAWLGERAPTLFTLLMCASFTYFSTTLLEADKRAPLLHKFAVGYAVWCLAAFFYAGITESLFRIYLCTALSIGTCLVSISLGVVAARRGSDNAFLFLSLWGVVLVGMFFLHLVGLYRITPFVFGGYVMNFVLLLAVTLWTLELAGRVKISIAEQRRVLEEQVAERTSELRQALDQVKTLRGLLPMCSSCKRIRDDKGHWDNVENYVTKRTYADFTHGICPECAGRLYPGLFTPDEIEREFGPLSRVTPSSPPSSGS